MQTKTPSRPTAVVLRPIQDIDPRVDMDEQSLALATRNSFPVVAQRRPKSDGMGMAAGVGVALLLGGATFWSMSGSRTSPQEAAPAPQPPAVIAPAPTPAPVPAIVPAPAPVAQAPIAPPLPSPTGVLGDANERLRAPVMVYDASSGVSTSPAAPAVKGAGKPNAAAAAAGGENEQFAARIGGESAETVSATAMENPSTTISQGTLIPAVLETAIDTDLPGYVRAVVSRDIKAFDGSNVLIPRSSRLIGQYKSGLQAGQQRAYVIWTRLIRPDGASIALGSPATDYAGRSGLEGKVDGHFLKRFGSAMLLSVVGGLGAIGSSGSSVVLSTGGQSAASVAASRDAQIPPTVRVRQGEPIRVFTARDLDFTTVGEWVKG
jgi:type IV secretion system protein VirB10